MNLFFLLLLLLSVANAEWAGPEMPSCDGEPDRKRCLHGKGDDAIRKGWIDFLGQNRGPNEYFEIKAPSILLVVHAAKSFDRDRLTESGTHQMVANVKDRNVPIVFQAHYYKLFEGEDFLNHGDFDFLTGGTGGDHNLRLPETETVVLSGGNLTECLCNSLADVIHNIRPGKSMTVVLPLETVYTGDGIMKKDFEHSDGKITLRQASQKSNSQDQFKELLKYTVANFIMKKTKQDDSRHNNNVGAPTMCPHQPAGNRSPNPDEFSYEVILHDSKLGEVRPIIGKGGDGPRKLTIVFASVDLVGKYLKGVAGPIQAHSVHEDWNGGTGEPGTIKRIERVVPSRQLKKPGDAETKTRVDQ